jgi:hypothetical protein
VKFLQQVWRVILRFVVAIVSTSGSLIVIAAEVVLHQALTWSLVFICGSVGLAADFWREGRELRRQLLGLTTKPNLVLRIDPNWEESEVTHVSATSSPFVFEIEGEARAYAVRIASSAAPGPEHGQLNLIWTPQSDTVGIEPVPISLFLEWRRGTLSSSFVSSQIREYMRQVVGKKELVAVASFMDSVGNHYEKRFRVYEERDGIGFLRIRCEPMKD